MFAIAFTKFSKKLSGICAFRNISFKKFKSKEYLDNIYVFDMSLNVSYLLRNKETEYLFVNSFHNEIGEFIPDTSCFDFCLNCEMHFRNVCHLLH